MMLCVHLQSTAVTSNEAEVISPELALVDPVLAEAARARLRDPGTALSSRRSAGITRASAAWIPDEVDEPVRHGASGRTLIGIAAMTILAVLLFDVRVDVGKQRASAETQAINPASAKPPSRRSRSSKPDKPPATTARPRRTRSKPTGQRFAWAPVAGATGYSIEFFRGANRVFAHKTRRPALTVPARWSYGGTSRTFQPGEYRWYVWPIVGELRSTRASVQSTVLIPPG